MINLTWPKKIPTNNYSLPFLQGMLNRVAVGYLRYNTAKNKTAKQQAVQNLNVQNRIDRALARYQKTGNTEFLIDAANYAMLEFMNPQHKNAHFVQSDSDPTPSLVAFFHSKE